MLEYFKTILSKVSFDPDLFKKELLKAINNLVHEEILKLKEWCYQQFGHTHQQILNYCFLQVA